MPEKQFVDGLIAKKPHENAPEFVKATLSIQVRDLIKFLEARSDKVWLNVDIKESRGGKWYAELNTFEKAAPTAAPEPKDDIWPKDAINPDDIPF